MIWKIQKKKVEVTARKTIKSEVKKIYNELIQKDNDALERKKLMEKEKKLMSLENIIAWIFSKM